MKNATFIFLRLSPSVVLVAPFPNEKNPRESARVLGAHVGEDDWLSRKRGASGAEFVLADVSAPED